MIEQSNVIEHRDGHNGKLARLLVEKEVIFAEDVGRAFCLSRLRSGNYGTSL